jgi:adenylate kinase
MSKGPNILITGTPGTGKTSLCQLVAEKLPSMRIIDVGGLVKAHDFHEGYDDVYQTYILDEDKLLDYLEPIMEEGNKIVDFHTWYNKYSMIHNKYV